MNSVLLVRARDQGAILVLMSGPSLITCMTYSIDIFLLLIFLTLTLYGQFVDQDLSIVFRM